jgi:hypothetical protein
MIEEIVLKHSQRGMKTLQNLISPGYLEAAAQEILQLKKGGKVLLFTGFYVNGAAETDGPIGTFFLARALANLGFEPMVVSDTFCQGFFVHPLFSCQEIMVPLAGYANEEEYGKLLQTLSPEALISIERCGQDQSARYRNMRQIDISQHTAPLDLFFDSQWNIPSIGIGDGGNEIGMGRVRALIEEHLPQISACVIPTRHLIIATTSNWGAYGLVRALEKKVSQPLMPSFEEVRQYLAFILSQGAVDGVLGKPAHSVDGFDIAIEKALLEELHRA